MENNIVIETTEIEKNAFAPEEIMVVDDVEPADFVVVEEPGLSMAEEPGDYEKTQKLSDFMSWIRNKMNALPPHSGKTTAGCERVIAHLKMLDKEISKAISRDLECVLDDQAVEKFRKEIRKMIKKLEKRHKEINEAYDADDDKFASSNENMNIAKVATEQKEDHACACQTEQVVVSNNCPTCNVKLWKVADDLYECIACDNVYNRKIIKEAGTPKVQLIMDPFQRAITGIIVNAVVSQGRNAEDVYSELKKQYKFSERDELGLSQLLLDLGYPVARNFVSVPHDKIEFATNYNA